MLHDLPEGFFGAAHFEAADKFHLSEAELRSIIKQAQVRSESPEMHAACE